MASARIVVGYDGSTTARSALDFAVTSARPRQASVEVVHAWVPPPPTIRFAGDDWGPQEPELRRFADQVLAEALDHVKDIGPDVDVCVKLVSGNAAASLLQAAEGAHMLVVGSRGLGGFSGRLLGSTGLQVATHATCPVVVVRPSEPVPATSPEEGRVVVGVDGSQLSEAVLAFAFEQASERGVGLTAMLTWDVPYLNVPGRVGPIPADVLKAESEHAATVLAESLAGWQERYPDVAVKSRADYGQARSSLIDASAGAILLVVGSRGRGGFLRLLLGSVSLAVLNSAHCPVAVIHQAAH